jgi:hypothetical protein
LREELAAKEEEPPDPVQTTTTESPYAQRPLPKWAKPAPTSHQHADSNSVPLQQGTHVSLESPPVSSNQENKYNPMQILNYSILTKYHDEAYSIYRSLGGNI